MSGTAQTDETDTETFVSWREFLSSEYASPLALVCLAVWLHAADSLIVATMLPSVVAEIGGAGLMGWSVSLYEIGSIVAGAASALLSMRFGLRAPMSAAAVLFGVGCLVSAVSPSMPVLLVGRAMQGVGGGGLVALGFVAAGVLFPRRYMARALAAISALWGVSAFAGPLVGGLFVEYATWRWGYGFFALQALACWIAWRRDEAPGGNAGTPPPFPTRRLALLCLAVVLIAAGGVEVSVLQTSGLVLAGLVCLLGFLRLDGRAGESRLLPLKPFDLRETSGAGLLMILCLSVATIAITAFGPMLMIAIHGISALTAGYIVACSSVGWTIAAVLISGSPERYDRPLIALGMAVIVTSVVGFLFSVPGGPVWLVAVFSLLEGAGFGLAWTFILRRLTAHAPEGEKQRIAGAMPTVQRLGYALGAAYIGIVANASGLPDMDTPMEAMAVARLVFLACLPFAAIGLIALVGHIRQTNPARST